MSVCAPAGAAGGFSDPAWFPAWLAGTPSPGAATLVDQVVAG